MNTEPVSVVIEGENFLALPTQYLGGEEPVRVDARFEAFLDEVALEDVTLEDAHMLRARVPPGLAAGWHSLAVVGPLGRRVELPRAYLSSDRPLARLGARAALERERVSVEERVRLLLTVENTGGTTALGVTPVLGQTGEGKVELISEPGPADIAGGGSVSFVWELEAAAPGDLRFTLEVRGREELTGVELRAPAVEVGPLQMRNRAVLASSLTVSRSVANVGQWLKVSQRVTNTGETAAREVVPGMPQVLGTSAVLVSGPVPASADVPAGESRDFEWTYAAGPVGTLAFLVDAVGHDAHSGLEVRALAARSAEVLVQRPGALEARFTVVPARVNVGQEFDVMLEVSNSGDSAVLGVKLEAMGASGTGQVRLVSGPEPASADIPGKGRVVFRARLAGTVEGTCVFHAGASGVDETDGASVTVSPVDSPSVTVQRPAALTASFSVPSRVTPGSTFGVSLTVTNTGDAAALGVRPTSPTASSGAAVLVSGPGSSPVDLAGGASTTFTWSYRAATSGQVSFTAGADGTDGTTGVAVASGVVSSSEVSIPEEARQLISNPLGDGTPFAHVLGYAGRLYLGPNRGGTGGVTLDLNGQGGRSFGFSFWKDTSSNSSQNTSPSPYPSIGATGCTANTSACGPDNEDGRGFFFAGWVGTQEWLGIGGARSAGDLDYVYLTQDTEDFGTVLMRFLDLAPFLGGQTKGFSSALFFQGRLYLGFPDTGGNRPYLIVAKRLPTADPGYDASSVADAEDLQAQKMPGIGSGGTPSNNASTQMIDTLVDFNDRLYVVNNGGCVRSTTTTPRAYGSFPGDWASCTPSLLAWSSRTSRTTSKTANLEPADRAVPQLAVFQGRLYLARNTTVGPQLFVCDPAVTGATAHCDPGDWSLVAANSVGDTLLTQLDNPANTSLSLLVATPRALYVGFDNTQQGVVVMRAFSSLPSSRADFTGTSLCPAAQHPTGCAGLGGNGLGVGATRLFDGKVLGPSGSESVYLTAGDGTGPVRLFRLLD